MRQKKNIEEEINYLTIFVETLKKKEIDKSWINSVIEKIDLFFHWDRISKYLFFIPEIYK